MSDIIVTAAVAIAATALIIAFAALIIDVVAGVRETAERRAPAAAGAAAVAVRQRSRLERTRGGLDNQPRATGSTGERAWVIFRALEAPILGFQFARRRFRRRAPTQ